MIRILCIASTFLVLVFALSVLFFGAFIQKKPPVEIRKFEQAIQSSYIDEYCLISSYAAVQPGKIVIADGREIPMKTPFSGTGDDTLYLGLLIKENVVIDFAELPRNYAEKLISENNGFCKRLTIRR